MKALIEKQKQCYLQPLQLTVINITPEKRALGIVLFLLGLKGLFSGVNSL